MTDEERGPCREGIAMYSRGIQIFLALVILSLPIADSANGAELELTELITAIKKSIKEAQKTAEPPYATVSLIEAEISYVLKKEGEGKFTAYVVTVGGKYATETIQRTKFHLVPTKPQDWRVGAPRLTEEALKTLPELEFKEAFAHRGEIREATIVGVDNRAQKIFVQAEGIPEGYTIQFSYGKHTTLTDAVGHNKSIEDIKAGTSARLFYEASAEGQREINHIILKGTNP